MTGANQTSVSGSITTPFTPTFNGTFDPVAKSGNSGWRWTNVDPNANPVPVPLVPSVTNDWGPNPFTTYTGGGGLPKDPANGNATVTSLTATSSTPSAPTFFVINGDFTVSGSTVFPINAQTGTAASPNYMVIWVKGKYTTSGSSKVAQAAGVRVVWIVDNDITTSGNSYANAAGTAVSTAFVSVSGSQNANGTWQHANKVTMSGSSDFIGQILAPGADLIISGGGSVIGAAVANTLNISGGSGFHYDECLHTGPSAAVGNYAFASWFEDNSAPGRDISY